MPAHKFKVGQKVRFTPEMGQLARRGATFVVVRQLPEAGDVRQYQIKSDIDGHARVVRENQLDPMSGSRAVSMLSARWCYSPTSLRS